MRLQSTCARAMNSPGLASTITRILLRSARGHMFFLLIQREVIRRSMKLWPCFVVEGLVGWI